MSLHVVPEELKLVCTILRKHFPDHEVWAFGSRVHGENLKPYSDLDLVVITQQPLDMLAIAEAKDDFTESALPFKVDLLDWSTTNDAFRKEIRRHSLVVQQRAGGCLPE